MKTFLFLLLFLGLIIVDFTFAQVPVDQDTIYIPGGTFAGGENSGLLEETINGDTITSGANKGERINPNRVYALNEGQVYYQLAPINMDNPNGILTIAGVPSKYGTTKPVILIKPSNGKDVKINIGAVNLVYGSLKFDNVYYSTQQLDGYQNNELFYCGTRNQLPQELIINNCVFEFCNIDLFDCTDESGAIGGWPKGAKFFITNSYFRNLFYPGQWWGSRIFQCKHPIDTLWVENCTITTGGLTFLQQNELTDFAYFNHNTIINNKKYWLLSPYHKTFFVANNIFINQNWVGEDTNIINNGTPFPSLTSTINIDTNNTINGLVVQQKYYVNGDSSLISDALNFKNMQVYISNNVNYYDSLLVNNYYLSPIYINDTVGTIPSYLNYLGYGSGPWKIENIPCEWMNTRTKEIFTDNSPKNGGRFIEESTWTVDPHLQTPAIPDAETVDKMAMWNQNQWGDPGFANFQASDILNSKYIYGDYDPNTIPGIDTNGNKTEDGTGIRKFTDFTENFSQITYVSVIDGFPAGSLIWIDGFNGRYLNRSKGFISSDEYKTVETSYVDAGGLVDVKGDKFAVPEEHTLYQNFPNPFNPVTTIQFSLPQTENVILKVYNILGQKVATLVNKNMKAGIHKVSFNALYLSSGVYIYRLKAGSFSGAKKMIVLK